MSLRSKPRPGLVLDSYTQGPDHPHLGECFLWLGSRICNAKIRTAVFMPRPVQDHDVFGLQVPVNDVLPVCLSQRHTNLEHDVGDAFLSERMVFFKKRKGPTPQILHGHVQCLVIHAEINNLNAVGMR